jgi:hypothetical protein
MQHRLDIAYDDYLYETSWSLRVSRPVLLCCHVRFNEVIEFGSLSQFASLLLATNPTCDLWFRRWLYVLYATMDDSHLLITAGSDPQSWVRKEHVKCVVHRIPNDRMTRRRLSPGGNRADPGSPALKMSCRGSSRVFSKVRKTGHFIPAWQPVCWSDLTLKWARCATDHYCSTVSSIRAFTSFLP